MSIAVLPIPDGMTIEQYAEQDIGFLQLLPKFRLLTSGEITFGGLDGFELLYTTRPTRTEITSLQLTTIHEARAYSLTFTALDKPFRKHLPTVRELARSFQLGGISA